MGTAKPGAAMQSRRRRQKKRSNQPIWAYFTSDEKQIVEEAAAMTRQSTSAFAADAILDRALTVIREHNQRVSEANRRR